MEDTKWQLPHPVWVKNRLQTTCMHVDDRQYGEIHTPKRGAECEHSEEFVEVDKRH